VGPDGPILLNDFYLIEQMAKRTRSPVMASHLFAVSPRSRMFVRGTVACPDGSPVSCASPAPTRTHLNASSCTRAWSATSEAIALSVRTNPVVTTVSISSAVLPASTS
jgi:hypothetical protein